MSNEINFKLELKGEGSTKGLILNHDRGQGADQILVSIGAEAIVVDPWELYNLCRRAFELLTDDTYEHQVRVTGPGAIHGVMKPADKWAAPIRTMPAPEVRRLVEKMPEVPKYDRDDK